MKAIVRHILLSALFTLCMSFGCSPAFATVPDNYTPARYDCDGVTKVFTFPFPLGDTTTFTDLKVSLADSAGAKTQLTYGKHYSVSAVNRNYAQGGTVTMAEAYTSAYDLWIERETETSQETSFTSNAWTAKGIENALDRLTRIVQEVRYDVSTAGAGIELDASEFQVGDLIISGKPWIDPRSRGAVGDGVADDTTAIQAAIDTADAAGGGCVFVPEGTFKITDPVKIPAGVSLRGVALPGLYPSRGSVIYQADGNDTCIIELIDDESHSIELSYLSLKGPGETVGDCNGILYEGSSSVYSSHLHHLYIEDVNNDAIHLEGAFSLEIDNINTDDIGGWAYNGDTGPGTNFHDWQFIKASTGGMWCWAGSPTVQSVNMEDVPIGLKFGNSGTNQTCLPNLYNINLESITNGGTGIWFNQGRPEYMHGITMYAAAGATVAKGVYFDSSNYGAFVTHAYVNFTKKSGGTYTNTYYADNGAISSIPIYIYDSDGAVAGMNNYMVKDSVVLYGESGDPTDGGIMAIGGTLRVDHNLVVKNGSTSAGYIDIYEDSDVDATAFVRESFAVVDLTNAQIKDLADTAVTLVAAPGAGKWLEFCGASLWLDYGSNALAEPSSPDNLRISYTNDAGPAASADVTASGFITATADTMAYVIPVSIPGTAASSLVNKALVLVNTGDDYTGNAGNDTVIRVIVRYRIHSALGL